MEDNEIMLDVVCYSEKEKIRLGFGFCISEEDKERRIISDPDEIENGISDSYYENWEDFELGIEKTRELIRENRFTSIKKALADVFGHFKLNFSIDGAEEKFEYDLDVNECVYGLLVESNVFEES